MIISETFVPIIINITMIPIIIQHLFRCNFVKRNILECYKKHTFTIKVLDILSIIMIVLSIIYNDISVCSVFFFTMFFIFFTLSIEIPKVYDKENSLKSNIE